MKKNKVLLIFTLFYLYFIIAIFESSRGNFIPFFIEEFEINHTTISLILSLNTLGSIIGSYLAGDFCEKYGHKLVYIVGSVASTIAVLIAPFTQNIFMLGLFYFIFGIGRSFIAIGVDSMIPILSVGFESILMNITHFMYGIGSFAGQSAYGKLLSEGMPWRTIYLNLGIFFIISIVLTFTIKTPNAQVTSESSSKRKVLYKNPLIYMFVFALAFGLLSEAIVNTWFISFMRESYDLSPAGAAKYASIFYLSFALGRLFGGFILNKTGNARGLKFFLLSASILILIGLQLGEKGLIVIALAGFFISITFPTMMVIISAAFKQNSSYAIGLIVTISNIVNVILFNVTGALNDLLGNATAFYLAPLSMMTCFTILVIITKKEKNIN